MLPQLQLSGEMKWNQMVHCKSSICTFRQCTRSVRNPSVHCTLSIGGVEYKRKLRPSSVLLRCQLLQLRTTPHKLKISPLASFVGGKKIGFSSLAASHTHSLLPQALPGIFEPPKKIFIAKQISILMQILARNLTFQQINFFFSYCPHCIPFLLNPLFLR